MKISIIGAGAMGGAMARGWLKGETFKSEDITVAAPSQRTLDRFLETGVSLTHDNKLAASQSDIVCVVVKPWLVEQVLTEIKPVMDYNKQILVVVAAGITSEQVNGWMAKDDNTLPPLFLVVPNTAIEMLSSMTFITPVNASDGHIKLIKEIFDETGETMIVEEKMLAAGSTIASCGIAYAMRYVRASMEGGVEIGFRADVARRIVLQTVKGAVALLQANGNHPEAEIDKVTTAGGITIRGLNEMEHAGFTSAVIRGLKAGMKKG